MLNLLRKTDIHAILLIITLVMATIFQESQMLHIMMMFPVLPHFQKEDTQGNQREHLPKQITSVVLKNADELIVIMTPEGIIKDVSESVLEVYDKPYESIVGQHALAVNESVNRRSDTWLKEVNAYGCAMSEATIHAEGQKKYIRWRHEALYDETTQEMIKIISIGREMTDYLLINEALHHEKNHDALTGLLNERGLFERLHAYKKTQLTAAVIDIYRFTQVNDYYGHTIGDDVLIDFAQTLKNKMPKGCEIARYSGSKFAVLCGDASNIGALKNILRDFDTYTYEGVTLSTTFSLNIGVADYVANGENIDQVIANASIASRESTNDPFHHLKVYTEFMNTQLKNNLLIASKLRHAIENHDIDIDFQSIINLKTHTVEYVEALARWHDEELGPINPETFINIADQANLLSNLENYLLEKAMEIYASHNVDAYLALNLTPQSMIDHKLSNNLLQWSKHYGIAPERIMIEISERTFVNISTDYVKNIERLKAEGFLIAIDDFGKDYSSLAVLRNVPYDMIKIDRMFTETIQEDETKEIIKMVKAITRSNNKMLVIEGVESKIQVEALKSIGCYRQQGYYHDMPKKLEKKSL